MSNNLKNFVIAVTKTFPKNTEYSRSELEKVKTLTGNNKGFFEFTNAPEFRIRHGHYQIPVEYKFVSEHPASPIPSLPVDLSEAKQERVKLVNDANQESQTSPSLAVVEEKKTVHVIPIDCDSLVPVRDPLFVPFGDFRLILNFFKSKVFFPIYVSGESGNGKTKMVYEACAHARRELIRANITESTDEDDLLGGFRLVNGETVWHNGPAITAMERGAILLLDEINLGSPKIMCLQPILEGNPIFLKKINKLIYPAPGFNIIATSNTKGKGSDDGRYIGSNIQNEAFLDRFAITIEHEYPSRGAEEKILNNILDKNNITDSKVKEFVTKLVDWANIIRNTFREGAINEVITTRRLIHVINFYIFGKQDKITAIEYATARFDEETKASIRSLYQKIDDTIVIDKDNNIVKSEETKPEDSEDPFV